MLTSIQRIRGLGVYGDYTPPAGTKPFGSNNVIYGWNYSGKTTLSRLFSHLERGDFDGETAGYTFAFDSDAGQITQANAGALAHTVRVFNSDFVQENLNFGNAHGRPILLLGAESETAQKEITVLVARKAKVVQAMANQQRKAQGAADTLAEAKKTAAAATKSALSLVEIYTATQLDMDLRVTQLGLNDVALTPEQLAADTRLARTSDEEALPAITELVIGSGLGALWARASDLLTQLPEVANAIKRLTENPPIAAWVERGLALHDHTANCEFCANPIAVQRLDELRAHFSAGQAEFKSRVSALLHEVGEARVTSQLPDPRNAYPQFRERLIESSSELMAAQAAHDRFVNELEQELGAKLNDPFKPRTLRPLADDPATKLLEFADALNSIIREHNAVVGTFKKSKQDAITRARRHYANEFDVVQRLGEKAKMQERYKARIAKIRKVGENFDERRIALEAQMNKAQIGREKINARIETLLGANCVQIEVAKINGEERFKLARRDGSVAKRLSEGEKTAVGFAFFLTKLEELPDLSKVIVFIDDPISSLDSNHIFQVASILKDAFFEKVTQQNPNGTEQEVWQTKCKQIFFSTHNFEFLSLLRELPVKNWKKTSHFLVQRKTPGESALSNMPDAMLRHTSEYHFLFSVIDKFHKSADKTDVEVLMQLPNAVRRFVELYTYAKYPAGTVDQRAEMLFGVEKGRRILKVLHHFSHGNNIERIFRNSDMSDVEGAVRDLIELIAEKDPNHLEALQST